VPYFTVLRMRTGYGDPKCERYSKGYGSTTIGGPPRAREGAVSWAIRHGGDRELLNLIQSQIDRLSERITLMAVAVPYNGVPPNWPRS
jgi:hypothetical protein